MDGSLQSKLVQWLPDKSRTVTVHCAANDVEAYNFATEIKDYLTSQGYSVEGVSHSFFSPPILGVEVDSNALMVKVGASQ